MDGCTVTNERARRARDGRVQKNNKRQTSDGGESIKHIRESGAGGGMDYGDRISDAVDAVDQPLPMSDGGVVDPGNRPRVDYDTITLPY